MRPVISIFLLLSLCALIGCNSKPQPKPTIKWSADVDSLLYGQMPKSWFLDQKIQAVLRATSDTGSINALNLLLIEGWRYKMLGSTVRRVRQEVYAHSMEMHYNYGIIQGILLSDRDHWDEGRMTDSMISLSLQMARQYGYKDLEIEAMSDMSLRMSVSNHRAAAMDTARRVLVMARAIGRKDLMMYSQSLIAYCAGYLDKALELDSRTQDLELAREIRDTVSITDDLINLSDLYKQQKKFNKAYRMDSMALELAIEQSDSYSIALGLTQLSEISKEKNEYTQAIQYKSLSLPFAGLASKDAVKIDIAGLYATQKKYDSAFLYLDTLIAFLRSRADTALYRSRGIKPEYDTRLFKVLIARSEISIAQGRYDAVLSDINRARALHVTTYDEPLEISIINMHSALSKVYLHQHRLNDALLQVDSAEVLIRHKDIWRNKDINLDRVRTEVYDSLHMPAKAYATYRRYIWATDSLNAEDNTRKFAEVETRNEEERVKAEQDKKDMLTAGELRKQKVIRNVSLGGAFVFICFALLAFYAFRQKRKDNLVIAAEKQKSETLLLNILPAEVAEELKEKGEADAKLFDEVTVLFTDFKGFTTVSERLSPQQLVDELHACFSAFDGIISKYNIEKIKTVGDAYLAVSGLPAANANHAQDMVNAAIEIRDYMLRRRKELGEMTFEVRIGLHSGPVVAGIVGVKKYAYDIWGDTVNTAARMEQNGEAGKVNISQTTYELVKDKFTCTHRGKIAAKNKGEIDMYFVE